MKIVIYNKNDKIIDESIALPKKSHHNENVVYLNNNSKLKKEMQLLIRPYMEEFFDNYISNGTTYINSGAIAVKICSELNLEQNQFYHSLVGSLLYEEFKRADPMEFEMPTDTIVVANKGAEQHWFDYFIKSKTLS